MKFENFQFLLVLECIWLVLFIVLSSLAFGLTPTTTTGHTMRTDIFAYRSHVFLGTSILAARNGLVGGWLFPFFLYQIFVDVVNLVQITAYSSLRDIDGLWKLAIAVGGYQVLVSLLALGWFLLALFNSKTHRVFELKRAIRI